jgi:sugar/nucleoside kinase (ribokinase family)
MDEKSGSIVAFCNPLLDMIAHVDHAQLAELGVKAGTMNLVEAGVIDKVRRRLAAVETLPGGSGANTARGFAWLNRSGTQAPPVFYGSVGGDDIGAAYIKQLEAAGVQSGIAKKIEPSGISLILVTPDFERTMLTHLGACRLFGEHDVDFERVRRARVVHLTGYMWDTDNQRRVAERAAAEARAAGSMISLDLADPFVVERYHDDFLSWIPGRVDLLFGNLDEFGLLCGKAESEEALLARAAEYAPVVVMKAGARGAYVAATGRRELVPGVKAQARDTTGAGDSFAAGYLYALLDGRDERECVRLGNRLAAAIVAVEGCAYGKIDTEPFAAERG